MILHSQSIFPYEPVFGVSSAVNEDFVLKAGASIDTRGKGTFGAGAGFQF